MEQQRQDQPKQHRGFATLSTERRREIARMGGKAAQARGRGHRWDREEARAAGRKGGAEIAKTPGRMQALGKAGGLKTSADREHMAEIGRRGGRSTKRARKDGRRA